MSELDEIKEQSKMSRVKSPNRKHSKKRKIAIIVTVLVISILLSVYVALTLMSQSEKYWKPPKEFVMPKVDWNTIKSSYVVNRTTYDQNGLNISIGQSVEDSMFSIKIIDVLGSYDYDPSDYDSLWICPYIYGEKISDSNYKIKLLEFKFDYGNDSNVSYLSLTWDKISAKNLYFDITPGKYTSPWGIFDNRLDYEWMNNFRIIGENKDGEDIKDAGISFPMKLTFFDEYPHWCNHTITFTAILEYGKYVNGLLGNYWEDLHKLSASVVIYVVPNGGV